MATLYILRAAGVVMDGVGLLEVRILALGMGNRGRVDERMLEDSGVGSAGTGRVLDVLASMIGRGMLRLNGDRSFQVTDSARQVLWDDGMPVRVRILRILEISPLGADRIAEYLCQDGNGIGQEIEGLRRNRLVLMSALRTGQGIGQVFEITPEGREALDRAGAEACGHGGTDPERPGSPEILGLLGEVSDTIKNSGLDEDLKADVLQKISEIRAKLGA